MTIIFPWLLAVKHCNLVTVIQRFYHFIATSELRFLSASSPEDPVLESRAITDLLREAGTPLRKTFLLLRKMLVLLGCPMNVIPGGIFSHSRMSASLAFYSFLHVCHGSSGTSTCLNSGGAVTFPIHPGAIRGMHSCHFPQSLTGWLTPVLGGKGMHINKTLFYPVLRSTHFVSRAHTPVL